MKTLPDLKSKPYGGAHSVYNEEIVSFVKENSQLYTEVDVNKFLQDFSKWATSTHTIKGMNRFKFLNYCNGTTETFDKFYPLVAGRRLRLWRGEYFYHQIQAREVFKDQFAWIDDDVIKVMDVVVVSVPFSDTGTIPANFYDVLDQCERLNVPVLIDMAYLNLASHLEINLDYNCIKMITTSLSKVFPVEHLRIGLRWMQEDLDDTLNAYVNQTKPYVNTHSVYIGHQLIKNYPADYTFKLYRDNQVEMCELLGVDPSDCVIFGIDTKGAFNEYNRGGKTNRLCFSKHL